MTINAIPTHLIHTVFQYILPPSLPIPPHLLSRALIQRHHFLCISPEDSASYLCWPSTQLAQVTEALESTPHESLASPWTSQPGHDVCYSAPDQETLFAHVRPHHVSQLQVIFVWDVTSESWRYHDARMLPFPEDSLSSLDAVLVQRSNIVSELSSNGVDETSSVYDDSYWTGYGSSGSSPATFQPTTADEDEKAEAAYWESYGDVHGTGDSTVPSPRPRQDCFPAAQKQADLRGPDITADPLITQLHLRLRGHSGNISPRLSSPRSEDLDYPQFVETENSLLLESNAVNGEGRHHANNAKIIGSRPAKDVGCIHSPMLQGDEKSNARREAEEGAKVAVRGIYQLWKAHVTSGDVSVFLEVVKSALEAS